MPIPVAVRRLEAVGRADADLTLLPSAPEPTLLPVALAPVVDLDPALECCECDWGPPGPVSCDEEVGSRGAPTLGLLAAGPAEEPSMVAAATPLTGVALVIALGGLLAPALDLRAVRVWLDVTTNWEGVGASGNSTAIGASLGAALGSPGPGSAPPPEAL